MEISIDIKNICSDFTQFIMSSDRLEQPFDEKIIALEKHLDRLAFSLGFIEFKADKISRVDDANFKEEPREHYPTIYAKISEHFLGIAKYENYEESSLFCDIIDDLTDIYLDVNAALWHMHHNSISDGLFELELTYRHHWRRHLRCLQLYLVNFF